MTTEIAMPLLRDAVDKNDFEAFRGDYKEFLNQFGAFRESLADNPTKAPVMSAIFGKNCFHLKETTDEQAQNLLKDSRAASTIFGKLSLSDRLEFIKVLKGKIDAHAEEIMLVITADTGKPIDLSKKEMGKGKEWFDYAAAEAENQIGVKTRGQQTHSTQPLGAAQIIGAYNYPYALAIGGIVGALTTGNGVIVSAPAKAPNWVFPFMEAAREAVETFTTDAIKKGTLSAEDAAQLSKGLVQYSVGINPGLTASADVVHFVGGDATGEIISKSRGSKKTILEMGGSNVVVVMKSAIGAVNSAEGIAQTIYEGFGPATGQRCTAPRMLCVEKGSEQVADKLGAICDELSHKIGNPFKSGIEMGPLVDPGAHQRMEQAIVLAEELAKAQGINPKEVVHGVLKVGDNTMPQAKNGNSFWVGPIVIDWRKIDLSKSDVNERVTDLLRHEIFGPLLHIVHSVDHLDGAIATTNKLDSHGLAGAIFTGNEDDVSRYQAKTSITSLTVNGAPKDRSPEGPHGHPGRDLIGGTSHFNLYGKLFVRAGAVPGAQPAVV